MSTLLARGAISECEKYKKEFLEYAKEKTTDIFISKLGGGLVDGAKGFAEVAGIAIDMAVEAGGFGIGWNKQTKKNCELAGILSKYYDGRKMEAYQMSGQLMYVNGVKVVNNDYTDEIRLNILENAFKKQINLGTENKYYSEFFPEGCDEDTRESVEKALQNSNSAEYKSAFIEWYLEGIGDGDHTSGQYYRN